MIAPLMVSIFTDGLRSVKPGWLEGSLALGVNRWRTIWKIGVRTARPAIVAGTVLAVARAIGEAVMLAMISGSIAFAPNPADGLIFIYEPSRPLAPTIVKNIDQLSSPPANATLFAIAAVLLFSAAFFSLRRLGRAPLDAQVRVCLMDSSLADPAGVTEPPVAAPRSARAKAPTGAVEGSATWSLSDRIGLAFCWALGLLFCAIAVAIVVYLFIQGIKFLKPSMLVTPAAAGFTERRNRRLLRRLHRHPDRRHDGDRAGAADRRRDRGLAGRVRPADGAGPDHRDRRSRRSPASPRSSSPCSAR